jgi:hypothetical protein
MPVSTDGAGSGVIVPSANRSYCMKTRFQISMIVSPWPFTNSARLSVGSSPMK